MSTNDLQRRLLDEAAKPARLASHDERDALFLEAVDRIEALEVALSNYTGGSHCNPARIAIGLEPFRNGFALPLEDGVIK
jgi:hypothetical protein